MPVLPLGARVSTREWMPILTLPPDVSTNPPSPPASPPRALMLPLMLAVLLALSRLAISVTFPPLPLLPSAALADMLPLCWMLSLAIKRMVPPLSTKPLASSRPVLLTTPPCNRLAAWADMMIKPPGANTAWPLSTKAATVAGSTRTFAKREPSNCNSNVSPAVSATVPICATTTPVLRTSGASSAM